MTELVAGCLLAGVAIAETNADVIHARPACGYQPVLRNSSLAAAEADLARSYDEAWCAGAGALAAGEAGS